MNLEQLLQSRRDLWRGRAPAPGAPAGLPSGYAALDEALGGRGWPRGAVTEIIGRDRSCVAAVPLLLPALAGLDPEAGWVALVDPPFIPYAPALAGHGGARFHVAGRLELNHWNGRVTPQLRLDDAAPA